MPFLMRFPVPDQRAQRWGWHALFLGLLLALSGPARAFDFDAVAAKAAALARSDYRPPAPGSERLAKFSYDEYRSIRFRPERALWRDTGSMFEVQFFPLGRGFTRPLQLFEVVGDDVRPLSVPAAAFDAGKGLAPGAPIPVPGDGAAGFRVSFPLNEAQVRDEVAVFLGASYFRAVGVRQAYGLSARGLALDTAGGSGEEFPAFTAFWLVRPAPGARELSFFALLDSPRASGAYRFVVRPGADTVIDVQARVYLRAPVAMLGIAPLTSMFLAGENQPVADDYRPEVHDSDGLLIAAADGERLWRPLINPARPFVTSFALTSPKGFGLMQRDRAFTSYEDLEAHYERRPGAWVEAVGDWGPGRVELLQFGTPNETHDNIAAYWVPDRVPAPGQPLDIAWRVHWTMQAQPGPPSALATVLQTRRGHGYREERIAANRQQLHVDFSAAPVKGLNSDAPVEVVVSSNANVRVLQARAYPNAARGGWRMNIEYERIDTAQPVELRAQLKLAGHVLSETWSYALAPE